jgi:hypothetical protein
MDLGLRFVIGVFVTWRVTHLLTNEDGPADLIARFRAGLGSGPVGKLMDCFQCASLWVGLFVAFIVTRGLGDLILSWLALSGAACLLERIGQEPVIIQPISQAAEGGTNVGMLRSEASGPQEDFFVSHDNASCHNNDI